MEVLDYKYLGDLVVRAQGGDSNAFAELYSATYEQQYRYAYKYLRDEDKAQDALQETFVQVLRNLRKLREPNLFIAWINRINFRTCYDMQKKEKKAQLDDNQYKDILDMNDGDKSPETEVVEVDSRKFILDQVMSLPLMESQALLMRYYQNMTIDEIGTVLNVSRSTVKRYMKSGKQRLKKLLGDMS
ncbi:MAG: sigma-70 family RNA polymerase sigma factor [Firmicutes bacterium]|nr:sigma-70 family RNA polymerase sigma factor [Bacillota bacterium]